MEVTLREGFFMGEKADIRIHPSSFVVRCGAQETSFPLANIIAVHVKDSKELSESEKRVKATLLVLDESSKDTNEKASKDRGPSSTFNSFEIEFTYQPEPFTDSLILTRLPPHLLHPPNNGEQQNIHVVISTLSGTQKAANFFSSALKPLLDHLQTPSYQVHETQSSASITQLTQEIILPRANAGIEQTIILLSGDGGVVDIVNALLREDEDGKQSLTASAVIPTIALIPMGTGNALFNSSCRPRQPPQPNTTTTIPDLEDQTLGLRPLLFGTPKPLPSFPITFSPGSSIVSYPSSPSSPSEQPKPIHTPLTPPNKIHASLLLSWCLHASLISLSDSPVYRRQGSARFTAAAERLLYPSMRRYRGVVSVLRAPAPLPQTSPATPTRFSIPEEPEPEQQKAELEEWIPLREPSGAIRRQHIYILVTTVRELERGFCISPLSGPVDGRLRLVSIGGEDPSVGADEVVRVLKRAWEGGRHVQEGGGGGGVVGYEEVEGVRVDFEKDEPELLVEGEAEAEGKEKGNEDGDSGFWRRVCVDGTIVECPRGGWVEIRKNNKEKDGMRERQRGEVVRLVVP